MTKSKPLRSTPSTKNFFREPEPQEDESNPYESSQRYMAKECGFTYEDWMALPEVERIRLEEYRDDKRFAEYHESVEVYRAEIRARHEASKTSLSQPQWLRDEFARDKPVEVVLEYLELLTLGAVAEGEELKEILRKISGRVGRGIAMSDASFDYWEWPEFEEMKEKLMNELRRVGLEDLFLEAAAQQRMRVN